MAVIGLFFIEANCGSGNTIHFEMGAYFKFIKLQQGKCIIFNKVNAFGSFPKNK